MPQWAFSAHICLVHVLRYAHLFHAVSHLCASGTGHRAGTATGAATTTGRPTPTTARAPPLGRSPPTAGRRAAGRPGRRPTAASTPTGARGGSRPRRHRRGTQTTSAAGRRRQTATCTTRTATSTRAPMAVSCCLKAGETKVLSGNPRSPPAGRHLYSALGNEHAHTKGGKWLFCSISVPRIKPTFRVLGLPPAGRHLYSAQGNEDAR